MSPLPQLHGLAASDAWQRAGLSSRTGATAADAWAHGPMTVAPEVCTAIVSAVTDEPSLDRQPGAPTAGVFVSTWSLGVHALTGDDLGSVRSWCPALDALHRNALPAPAEVVAVAAELVTTTNALHWRFELDALSLIVKRYDPWAEHDWHIDWSVDPTAATRRLALSVQLSDPDEYAGGDLLVCPPGPGPERTTVVRAPRERGSVTAFLPWVPHAVETIGPRAPGGSRWSLIVNGWGAPLV